MSKFVSRIFSLFLALVALISLLPPAQKVSAAATIATITDSTIILRNEKNNKCINNYAGGTYNGNKTTLWEYSRSDTDLWVKVVSRNGGYKIFDHELRIVIGDVFRGSKTKAAAGMKIDAWADQSGEDAFQIWIFERQTNGSYIIRLKSNKNLTLGITKNKNGAQLQLVKYNKSDASQRWFICGTDGKKLNRSRIESSPTSSAPSKDLASIPSSKYRVNATYTIGSTKYQYCTVTKIHGAATKGTEFFLEASNKSLVTSQTTLSKLETIRHMNNVRQTYITTLESFKNATLQMYECAAAWNRNAEMTKLLGSAGGAGLRAVFDCSTGNASLALLNCGKTIASEMAEPETVLSCTSIVMLKALSADTVYYCNQSLNDLEKSFSDYNKAVTAAEKVAIATAYYNATAQLGRPILDDIVESDPWKTTLSDLGMSLLEGALGDTIGLVEAASIAQNIDSVSDFLDTFKIKRTFDDVYARISKALILG